MTTSQKRLFYSLSFAMALAQIACFFILLGRAPRPGGADWEHLVRFWGASGAAGIACAFIGGGDPAKHSFASVQFFALLVNGVILVMLGIFYMASFVHD